MVCWTVVLHAVLAKLTEQLLCESLFTGCAAHPGYELVSGSNLSRNRSTSSRDSPTSVGSI